MQNSKHYPFVYQAIISWYSEEIRSNKMYRIAGVGFCESLADAASQIEKYEGENLLCIEHLEIIGDPDENLIEIPPRLVETLIHTDSFNMMQPLNSKRMPKEVPDA